MVINLDFELLIVNGIITFAGLLIIDAEKDNV